MDLQLDNLVISNRYPFCLPGSDLIVWNDNNNNHQLNDFVDFVIVGLMDDGGEPWKYQFLRRPLSYGASWR
ncbi:MAG: hypothetical protein AB7V56_13830 [Candidatus Nitrosocosmicus sp.]